MFSNHPHRATCVSQNLCDEQSQSAVAEHRHPFSPVELDLLEHLKRRRQRFDEDGLIVIHRFRQDVKIHRRQAHEIRECAVMIEYAEHASRAAMRAQTGKAQIAPPADNVDFAAHTLTDKISLR